MANPCAQIYIHVIFAAALAKSKKAGVVTAGCEFKSGEKEINWLK